MDVIIVCHVEFGFVEKKNIIFAKHAVEGVREGVAKLEELGRRYGAKITYAVCPEVVDYFPRNIEGEIGLHIHPGWEEFSWGEHHWHVGDAYLKEHCKQSGISSGLAKYSFEEQEGMIRAGKEYVQEKMGKDVKVFVAGRWSLNSDTVAALVQNGLTHDCSAVPATKIDDYDWSKLQRIEMPYHPDSQDYQEKGGVPLLIVPVSQSLFHVTMNPESARMVGVYWLKACVKEYYQQGVPLLHIAVHSPAMTDPYYYKAMEELLLFISQYKGVKWKLASEIQEYAPAEYHAKKMPYIWAPRKEFIQSAIQKVFRRTISV